MENLLSLKDKVAVVTGSSRGIGKSIAEYLFQAGATVIGIARKEEKLKELSDELNKVEKRFFYYTGDVSDSARIDEIAAMVKKEFGKVDILVNNAGITRDNLLLRLKKEDWQKVIDVNLNSVFYLTKAFLRLIMKSKGSIINISSVIGLMGNVGQSNYAASKAAIIGFSKSLAKELAKKGVRVNVVAPGYIQTDMTEAISEEAKTKLKDMIPMGKLGEPEDIAKLVLFLSSPLSAYITGQVLTVDGGMVM
jgi:3-oxoacyl-[acyl-carrier protein] reductase